MKSKKAQIVGQVFVYVFAAMIFAFVLVFGFRAVVDFNKHSEFVATIELMTKLRSSINSIAPSNSLERVSLPAPGQISRICFIDLRKNPENTIDFPNGNPGICSPYHSDYNQRLCWSWKDNVSKNIFFVPSMGIQAHVGDISLFNKEGVEAGYLCINGTQRRIYLEIVGMGDSAGIRSGSPLQ